MDEFQLKPLTEGLGFHKKKVDLNKQLKASGFIDQKLSIKPNIPQPKVSANSAATVAKPNSSLTGKSSAAAKPKVEQKPILSTPLPRKDKARVINMAEVEVQPTSSKIPIDIPTMLKESPAVSSSRAMEQMLKTLSSNKPIDFIKSKDEEKQTEAPKDAQWSFAAAFLDSMVVLAIALTLVIVVLLVTRVDLMFNITHPQTDRMVFVSLLIMLAGISFIYPLISRMFAGCTLGEWVFDLEVGRQEDRVKGTYSLKVLFRGVLNLITGFVLLPLLSIVSGKDLAGILSGAKLIRKVH